LPDWHRRMSLGISRPPAYAGAADSRIVVDNAMEAANFNMT